MSIGLEGCHVDIAWRAFSHSCSISKALGYFSVDDALDEQDDQTPISDSPPEQEIGVERNRKRFGFWHILRTDCLFRMSFGKPTLIPAGSWKVNFPDPTITGVDDESSHYIQIHFFASMRLAMVVMRYLDWIEGDPKLDPVSYDAIIESYIEEVQSILLDWDTVRVALLYVPCNPSSSILLMSQQEGLLRMATDHTDIWLCVDVLFSSYKMLIVLYQSKKCDQGPVLPYKSVDLARKFVQTFQSLVGSSQTFSGIRYDTFRLDMQLLSSLLTIWEV